VDYSGRGELADRQQKLNQMLSRLIKLAEEYNVAVVRAPASAPARTPTAAGAPQVITNQMTADPGGGMTFVPDPKKPVGGNVGQAPPSALRLTRRSGGAAACGDPALWTAASLSRLRDVTVQKESFCPADGGVSAFLTDRHRRPARAGRAAAIGRGARWRAVGYCFDWKIQHLDRLTVAAGRPCPTALMSGSFTGTSHKAAWFAANPGV